MVIQKNSINYLFILENDHFYQTNTATFKEAIMDIFIYLNGENNLFKKALNGFDENDIKDIIQIFNYFSYTAIKNIFLIEKQIY